MNIDKDYALALQLQEQFDKLNDNNVVNRQQCLSPVRSVPTLPKSNLGSPSWELTDPTPNVHALFIQFDQTFFWGKLASVVVRWSKRMYSCAGVCRYEGRKGLCDIALSEPLLKLRPRKDLVETLLHEMIHAYLFLTDNDRDRDGHGQNFLQHMHRINKTANVHISVYHDFIDEVRLYQTHWWRCNGPCQNQKPFFGMVRRTCNRAPGPSDYWWQRHQRMCSGKFIKIKEPAKKNKTTSKYSKSMKEISNIPDIRNFIGKKGDKNTTSDDKRRSLGNILTNNSGTNSSPNNIITVSKNNTRHSLSNIKSNSSSTVLITNEKTQTNTKIRSVTNPSESVKVGTSTSHTSTKIISEMNKKSENLKETVRNHWINKYSNNNSTIQTLTNEAVTDYNTKPTNKRPNEVDTDYNSKPNNKRPNEVDTHYNSKPNKIMKIENVVVPVCDSIKPVNRSLFYSLTPEMIKDCNEILSDLYGEDFTIEPKNFKSCSVNSERWLKASKIEKLSLKPCPICNNVFKISHIEMHIKDCIGIEEFNDNNVLLDSSDIIDLTSFEVCGKTNAFADSSSVIDLTKLDNHDPCTSNKTQIINLPLTPTKMNLNGLNLNDSAVIEIPFSENTSSPIKLNVNTISDDYCNCPICNKQICRNNADEHLEECVSKTFAGDDVSNSTGNSECHDDASSVHSDDVDETFEYNASGTKIICPCCFFLVEETQMNAHLDSCLL